MATIRSQIIDAIVSALDDVTKPSGLKVERFRLTPVEVSDLPSCIVRPSREEIINRNSNNTRGKLVERTITIRLELRAAATSLQSADQALEDLLRWATKALQKGSGTLGGLVIEINETSIEWDAEAGQGDYGLANVDFLFRYTTKTEDQEARQ